jgi:DNA-directed RNA polymerase specialized sigma24 family protein
MSAILVSLNSEWGELARTSDAQVARWRSADALRGAESLDQVLQRVRQAPDATLAVLLTLGASGDRLAWRVVLQAMLPKAVRLSAGREDRLMEAVSELWLAIAEYPLARRPHSIAANLAWTLHRRLAPTQTFLAQSVPVDVTADDTLAHARSLGLIDDEHHRVLWLVYVAGLTSAAAGRELGISAELVRYRCSRSVRRLAGQAELLAA